MTPDWTPTVFWPALVAAGMLQQATTILPGHTEETAFYVDLKRPDVDVVQGARSTDWMIEYQYGDAPGLREGAQVIIGDVLYEVREDPYVDLDSGAHDHFRKALLSRVGTACRP